MRHLIFLVLVTVFVLQGGQNWHHYAGALMLAAWHKYDGRLLAAL